jgi:hypothetical protein
MDDDERRYGDADAQREMAELRHQRAADRRRRTAWDEPPDYYDDPDEEVAP